MLSCSALCEALASDVLRAKLKRRLCCVLDIGWPSSIFATIASCVCYMHSSIARATDYLVLLHMTSLGIHQVSIYMYIYCRSVAPFGGSARVNRAASDVIACRLHVGYRLASTLALIRDHWASGHAAQLVPFLFRRRCVGASVLLLAVPYQAKVPFPTAAFKSPHASTSIYLILVCMYLVFLVPLLCSQI